MTWKLLSNMADNECQDAAIMFKRGAQVLGVNDIVMAPMFDVLTGIIPSEAYAGITNVPSISGFKTVLNNIKDYLEEQEYENILAMVALLPQPDLRPSVNTNTVTFAALALIDVMAGCSKMGMGNEDSIGVIEGSRLLATTVFEDVNIKKAINTIQKLYKNQNVIRTQLLLPFMFTQAILLKDNSNSILFLPKNLSEFQRIQATYFGDCLTEASRQARKAYIDLIDSEAYKESPWLDDMELPVTLYSQLMNVSHEAKSAIENRIEQAGKYTELAEHLNVAKQWLRLPYNIIYPTPPSVARTESMAELDNYGLRMHSSSFSGGFFHPVAKGVETSPTTVATSSPIGSY